MRQVPIAPLEIFVAEHIQVAERQRAVADPGQERGELSGLGRAEFSMPRS
jgi:hypothetical protein